MNENYEIAIVLTFLSFGIPILYFIVTRKALSPFSLRQLTKSFNLALVVQIILAGLYLGLIVFMEKKVYAEGQSSDFTDIFMHAGITYTIVGAFFYIPGLILLNIFSFFFQDRFYK